MYCVSDVVTVCKRVACFADSARGILAVAPVRLLESVQAAVAAQLSCSLRPAAVALLAVVRVELGVGPAHSVLVCKVTGKRACSMLD